MQSLLRRCALVLVVCCGCEVASDGAPSQRNDAPPSSAPSAAATASAATAPVLSASAPVAPGEPARRGLFLWELGKNGPPAKRAAELCQSWGVHRVFLKATNGNQGARWSKNASPENIQELTSRGIEVWLFGYFYGEGVADADGRTWGTIAEQADQMLAVVARAPAVTGVIVDAEEEFKGRPDDAKALCTRLRNGLGDKKLGYTSYGWLKPNERFPFKTFDRYCGDVFLPQVYYAFGWPGRVDESLARLRADLDRLALSAPVWEVQSNEKDPSVDEMQRFFEASSKDASIFYMHPEATPQTAKLARLRFR